MGLVDKIIEQESTSYSFSKAIVPLFNNKTHPKQNIDPVPANN